MLSKIVCILSIITVYYDPGYKGCFVVAVLEQAVTSLLMFAIINI